MTLGMVFMLAALFAITVYGEEMVSRLALWALCWLSFYLAWTWQ